MIKIEKNILIPSPKYSQYPILELEIGDSFFVEHEDSGYRAMKNNMWAAINSSIKKNNLNRKHVIRKVDGGLRVWRIM